MQSPSDTHMTTPGSVSHEAEREPSGCGLGANVDVLVCRAEWYYHVGAYQVRACILSAWDILQKSVESATLQQNCHFFVAVMAFRLIYRSSSCLWDFFCTAICCLAKAVALVVRYLSSLQDVHSAEA